ncbi:MAG: hypothetical protein K2P94_08230, partial [Rhodospirillaceae bacterium]|nr:hypothetical protein [Rhodospirillaceae bacterium]
MKKALLLAIVFSTLPAAAQQALPKSSGDPLKEICTGFLEQGGAGVSGDRNKLCTCLVRETQGQLTRQEMEVYSKAAETGQPPPPA